MRKSRNSDIFIQNLIPRQFPRNSKNEVFVDIGGGTKPNPNASIVIDVELAAKPDIVCDIGAGLPFPDNSVDKITAQAVLEHLTHDQNRVLLQDIERVLKPYGTFWFRVPHYYSIVAADDPTHKSYWTTKTLEYFVGQRLRHVFKKSCLEIIQNRAIVEFPTPMTLVRYPRYRIKVTGGPRLEQLIKLPFVFGFVEGIVRKT